MNAVLLDGTRRDDKTGAAVRHTVIEHLETSGVPVLWFYLPDIDIAPCRGDLNCWMRSPGVCAIDDANREISRVTVGSDIVALLTPITFGGYASELKKALDHLIPHVSPFFRWVAGETHHDRRYDWAPHLVAFGTLPRPDEESELVFRTLVRRTGATLWAREAACAIFYETENVPAIEARVREQFARAEAIQ